MSDLTYRPDVESPAWEAFVTSLDPAQLERERMRVGDLKAERFGSREHHEAMWLHEVRRVESRRLIAGQQVPVWFADWQLAAARRAADAQQALRGPVSRSEGRVASATHENTSTTVNPATGLVASNWDSSKKWTSTSTKREEAA